MAELTDQERADLEALMRVSYAGGKLSHHVLTHFIMGSFLYATDLVIGAHRKAIAEESVSDELAGRLVDCVREFEDARRSLVWLSSHIDQLLSRITGVSTEEVARMVGELSSKHHPADCGCGMHEAQPLGRELMQ